MFKRIPDHPPHIKPYSGDYNPLWSVMIPVYNCIDYLKETMESVLQQDAGLELMQIEVVDDCSSDGDVEELVKKIGKGRIGYYRQEENLGSLRNFETCINRSKGKYIHLLHGDDRIEVGFYDEIAALFRNYPKAGAAYTNFNFIDNKSRLISQKKNGILEHPGIIPDFFDKIAVKNLLQPPAIVVKRTTFEALGSFFAVHFGEDWEMYARIGSKFPVAYSPKHLASYRLDPRSGITHKSFLSGQNFLDMRKVIDIIQQYLPEHKRSKIKKAALADTAQYTVKCANSLLLNHRKAALRQVKGAWGMSKDRITLYYIIRFYAMYILRYKQIESLLRKGKKIELKKNS
ncbi:glycosyltransferase family 2 protein [Maribacter arenosus]|uniref:Glycosyltransferase n=1 Tax=Maribacter arenosus TaxID=1854708 RepID=A0ABR7VE24_9FLAO|nr:glycosyltransferase [Maribacter arenosus]MBD0850797.1 glycosyltransferase [Maribacter arenosus]